MRSFFFVFDVGCKGKQNFLLKNLIIQISSLSLIFSFFHFFILPKAELRMFPYVRTVRITFRAPSA